MVIVFNVRVIKCETSQIDCVLVLLQVGALHTHDSDQKWEQMHMHLQ